MMFKTILSFLFICAWFISEMPLIGITSVVFDDFSLAYAQDGNKLSALSGEWIRIRGFWYPLSKEEGILAGAPQLKSCCLRAPSKIENQLLVLGDSLSSLPSERAVTLEGRFFIRPKRDPEGKLIQLFVLEEARKAP